jgi:hypothetical protein
MRAVQQPTVSSHFKKRSSCREWGFEFMQGAVSIELSLLPIWKFLTSLRRWASLFMRLLFRLSFAHVNSDKGSFIAATMPMLLGTSLAPIHCLSSRSLTSNTSREFTVYYVLQDCRSLGLCLASLNLWRSTTSQTFPAGGEDIALMWRLNVRLHKVVPVDLEL